MSQINQEALEAMASAIANESMQSQAIVLPETVTQNMRTDSIYDMTGTLFYDQEERMAFRIRSQPLMSPEGKILFVCTSIDPEGGSLVKVYGVETIIFIKEPDILMTHPEGDEITLPGQVPPS